MANIARVGFSGAQLDLLTISRNHDDVVASVRNYFSVTGPTASTRFVGYLPREIEAEMHSLLLEHDRSTALTILAAVEAAFRIDYLQRRYKKEKDSLSRALRDIYDQKGEYAGLTDDILPAWKDHTSVPSRVISYIKGAFRYRHWLAHGRYWVPKLGRVYDYSLLYTMAETVFEDFPLLGAA